MLYSYSNCVKIFPKKREKLENSRKTTSLAADYWSLIRQKLFIYHLVLSCQSSFYKKIIRSLSSSGSRLCFLFHDIIRCMLSLWTYINISSTFCTAILIIQKTSATRKIFIFFSPCSATPIKSYSMQFQNKSKMKKEKKKLFTLCKD